MKKNPVTHFEMPYDDAERVSKFYTEAFGWEMQSMGKEMGDYIMAYASETDDKHMVKNPGNINGGFTPKSDKYVLPSVVVEVEDINAAISRVKSAGGTVSEKPINIPGIGEYVAFVDTEGNGVGMIEPAEGQETQEA